MLREQRSREKLEAYYRQFRQNGVIDQNVHPWVADSWLKSRDLNILSDRIDTICSDVLSIYKELSFILAI